MRAAAIPPRPSAAPQVRRPQPSSVSSLLAGRSTQPSAAAGVPILYYRDPDKALYAQAPAKTPDGRDYLPVHLGEDVASPS
jgi:Cu(I)/Ag(I) efflux system membrane fusion protein